MIQALHILRKDIRHLWPDLSAYIALLVAFGVVIPMDWSGANAANLPLRLFIALLRILIPILWIVMIARLIHDESLIGDQQFWITRPYKWASLLGAKLLFVGLCMVLPFVFMQWALLLQAGLNPMNCIPAQLLGLLFLALIAWLPLIAVASVTSTVQRMLMSLLAAVIVSGAILAFVSNTAGPRTPSPFAFQSIMIVLSALLMGTLIYQYASRDTFRSRVALVGTAVVLVILFWGLVETHVAEPANSLIRRQYPISTDPSLHLAFDASLKPTRSDEHGRLRTGDLRVIQLPINIQGLDGTTQLELQSVSFKIDLPDYHYGSPWRPTDFQDGKLRLFVPQNVLDMISGSNVRMHLSVAAQRFRPGAPTIVTATDDFPVPEGGRCHLPSNQSQNNMSCRFPFQIASRIAIQAMVSTAPCGSARTARPDLATLGMSVPAPSTDPTTEKDLRFRGSICPGTQLTITPFQPTAKFRLELDIPSISLEQYRL